MIREETKNVLFANQSICVREEIISHTVVKAYQYKYRIGSTFPTYVFVKGHIWFFPTEKASLDTAFW